MHKVTVKKTNFAFLCLFINGAAFAAPFVGNYDLSSYDDLASGVYDLDRQLSTLNTAHNVAGIYQVNDGQSVTGSMAEIHQIGGSGNRAMVWQSGTNQSALIEQTDGYNNAARLAQSGSGHIANLIQNGGSNNVMMVQMLGSNARIDASQVDATSSSLSVVLNSGSRFSGNQTGAGNNYSINLPPNTSMTLNQTGVPTSP